MENLFLLENLSVWYDRKRKVIDELDIEINDNEIVGLIGLNGAGKTTLFNTICGIHPKNKYSAKNIVFKGKNISLYDKNFQKDRYIVFSEDESFQYFTFNEYIKYTFSAYSKKIDDGIINSLCQKLHFTENRDILIRKLSLGNKRKVHIITGLALRCKLLILDEPFNGIDFEGTEELYKLLSEYKEYGSVIFSSHIIETICMITDRIFVLENGKISNKFNSKNLTSEQLRREVKYV